MIASSLYLDLPFAQHALIGGTLVAVACGLISPFVVTRGMSFAVHGTSELAFTGAAAGLVVADNPIVGALVGSVVVALVLGVLRVDDREGDATIGVILAFGLGMGALLLSHYEGFASEATSILFGDIFGISVGSLVTLAAITVVAAVTVALVFRPLLFASVDPEVATARGVPVRLLGIVFLVVLAFTVTAAAQIVGTLLVLSLAITPAAAAQHLSANPWRVTALSLTFALVAADGGLLASLATDVRPTVWVTSVSFGLYVLARVVGTARRAA